jgi:hypothetical protein
LIAAAAAAAAVAAAAVAFVVDVVGVAASAASHIAAGNASAHCTCRCVGACLVNMHTTITKRMTENDDRHISEEE